MRVRFVWAGAAAVLLALVIACGGPTKATANGNFRVMLKDSPFSDAKAVLVTFSEVSVHASGGGWTTVVSASRTCDLKQLLTAQEVLGTAQLEPGHYTQVRVTVTGATLNFDSAAPSPACVDGTTTLAGSKTIDVPSGQLIFPGVFDIAEGATLTMTLDFDGDKSITLTGNGKYIMTPVIAVVSVQ